MSKHNLAFVGLQHLKWERGYPETLVLYRCECGCGKTKTQRLDGIWTAKQLGFEEAA